MRVLALLFVISCFPFFQQQQEKSDPSDSINILRDNPLTLFLAEPSDLTFLVYNASGEVVLYSEEKDLPAGVNQPDLSWRHLPDGIYYLNISNGTVDIVKKLIIRGP